MLLAMKVIFKKTIEVQDHMRLIQQEIRIHKECQHPNIVDFYSDWQDDEKIIILLEYMQGGTLFAHLQQQPEKRLSEEIAASFVYQILLAVAYLHDNFIIHRDIKPENILVFNVLSSVCPGRVGDRPRSEFY